MHGRAAGSSVAEDAERRKKSSAEKRKNRSRGSKWRRGTGAAKVARSHAWRETYDCTGWRYWVQVFQYRNPHAVTTGNAVRKFIIELWQKSLASPVGPPTGEYWTPVYRQEDNVTFRQLNKVIDQVAPTSEQDLDYAYLRSSVCNKSRELSCAQSLDHYGDRDASGGDDVCARRYLHGDELSDTESSSSGEEQHQALMRRMADSGTGGCEHASVGTGGPVVLFSLCPVEQRCRSSEEVFRRIQVMRGGDFMNETGFIWATGTSKGAKGKKVQWRFEHSSSFVPVGAVEPSIQELMEYVMPRFPPLAAKTTVEAFQIDAANRSPQQGRWFKTILRLAPFTGSFWWVAC